MKPGRLATALLTGLILAGSARGDIEIVAESGAQAPGEAAGVEFTTNFNRPVIGGGGHVAFGGRLVGPGISSANNDVLFAGFWYLLRPDCDGGSWSSDGSGEMGGRDAVLP